MKQSAGILESFFVHFAEHMGGALDQVEPQVYDVLLPADAAQALGWPQAEAGARVTFDPEAIADHPEAQLLAFGNPLLDQVFAQAQHNRQVTRLYVSGLNLAPHGLAARVQRSVQLTTGTSMSIVSQRVLHHRSTQWLFRATFISDEKVQEDVSVTLDANDGRAVRHLEDALSRGTSSEHPMVAYPDAPILPRAHIHALARAEVTRILSASAHTRQAELERLLLRETRRISQYFDDSRDELDARAARAKSADDIEKFAQQRHALARAEQAQIGELRRKMTLTVQVRLMALRDVVQPKINLRVQLTALKLPPAECTLVWDPALDRLDAPLCQLCQKPSLALALGKRGVVCRECAAR